MASPVPVNHPCLLFRPLPGWPFVGVSILMDMCLYFLISFRSRSLSRSRRRRERMFERNRETRERDADRQRQRDREQYKEIQNEIQKDILRERKVVLE